MDDAIVVRPSDLDFPVTTDASEVRDFLKADDGQVRVVFSTYHSAQVVGEAIKGFPGFELGVFDEAHKTAGRTELKFAFALEDKNIPIAKRVFMTATPRHYDLRKKDREGDSALVYSMDDPSTYGPIVHTLTFTEAVRSGIICDCKIIISVVTSDMLDEELLRQGDVIVDGDAVRARTVANQIALQKACEAHDLKKVFTFHSTVKSAADFTGAASSSVRAHLPGYEALHVSGEMATARREKVMQAFREADRAVLSNARCLTEGVDVPAVDLVAFLSPRRSKVDIVQAAGRSMRKAEGKQTGYVLLPLFLETAKNETIEEALERTDFAEAWDVIQALREQDAVLADIIREMREARGRRGGFDDARLRERIEVLGPHVSLDLIREVVTTQVVEQLGASWDQRFGELVAFKAREGHCTIPRDFAPNPTLANWVNTQRAFQRQRTLLPERKALLDTIGFDWTPRDALWEQQFAALVKFRNETGNCEVPQTWEENPGLPSWIETQRSRLQTLSPERKARLDAIGFDWNPRDTTWEQHFGALARYKSRYGDCEVPAQWNEDYGLGVWVVAQRANRGTSRLPPEREDRLNALGFTWKPFDAAWETSFEALKFYKEKYGHCDVPQKGDEDRDLARWVNRQRTANEKGMLAPERKARLDALTFQWKPHARVWDEMFAALLRHKTMHGNCNVPTDWPNDRRLASWVVVQRTNQMQMTPERRARLDAIGFEWSPFDVAWDQQFLALASFREEHGHCNVPVRGNNGGPLGVWVSNQRTKHRLGELHSDRIARLDAIGFEWNAVEAAWVKMFEALLRFNELFGHCRVPRDYEAEPRLGNWVNNQRALQCKGKMQEHHKARLDALGFEWSRSDR